MTKLVVRWTAVFVAVLLAAWLLPDYISYGSLGGVALFAAVLALLNMFVKPVLGLVTAPISCLTLGLFVLVINAFLFWLATQIPGGQAVTVGVAGAFLGALIVSVVGIVAARFV